jgi:hypothetical protein
MCVAFGVAADWILQTTADYHNCVPKDVSSNQAIGGGRRVPFRGVPMDASNLLGTSRRQLT